MKYLWLLISMLLVNVAFVNNVQAKSDSAYEVQGKYIVSIYYTESRKNNANSLKITLEKSGYLVNISRFTFERKMPTSSYIHFNEADHKKMQKVKEIMSSKLSETFTVHYLSDKKRNNEMSVVLVDK